MNAAAGRVLGGNMGIRGELFSTKVILQNRTYFFNVKENRLGDFYLNIVESKNRDEGGFERQSVILFADDLQEFLQGFDESLRVLEKAERDKRRGKAGPSGGRESDARGRKPSPDEYRGGRDSERGDGRRSPPAGYRGGRDSEKGDRRPRNPSPDRKGSRPERTNARPGRSAESPETRRSSRYGNKDREGQGENYRSKSNSDFTPRKRKVVVRKSK